MRNFFLAKRFNLMMIFAGIIIVHGSNALVSGHYFAGSIELIVGFIAGVFFDDDFTIPVDDRVYESEIVPDSSLLPIEWDKQFDEPVAAIPDDFAAKIERR